MGGIYNCTIDFFPSLFDSSYLPCNYNSSWQKLFSQAQIHAQKVSNKKHHWNFFVVWNYNSFLDHLHR